MPYSRATLPAATELPGLLMKALLIAALAVSGLAHAQFTRLPAIRTVAGNGTAGYFASQDNSPATSVNMSTPSAVAVDPAGNIYIAEARVVRKVSAATGDITTLAGTGAYGSTGDGGPATLANFKSPSALAVSAAGDVYIADSADNRVRWIPAGSTKIYAFAGTGTAGYGGNLGPATSALMNSPGGLAINAYGYVFIADSGNNLIRVVSGSNISVVAGTGTPGYNGDGALANQCRLFNPTGIAIDRAGNIFIADTSNYRIRKVDTNSFKMSTVAGNGSGGTGTVGSVAATSPIYNPVSVAVDPSGNLFYSDGIDNIVQEVAAADGKIRAVAGTGSAGFDNLASEVAQGAALSGPAGLAVDLAGNLFLADASNNRVRKVDSANGSVSFSNTDIGSTSSTQTIFLKTTQAQAINTVDAARSQLGATEYVVVSVSGCVILTNTITPAGTVCGVVVKFTPAYAGPREVPLVLTTTTGTFQFGLSGIGHGPQIAFTPGIITTIAGTGVAGYSALDEGAPANTAKLYNPEGIAVDNAGNVYIADASNHRVRKVDLAGKITTIAGNGTGAFSGDNGPAIAASLYGPVGLAVDSAGIVYIADYLNCRIRAVSQATGIIATVAGNGFCGYNGDGGPATTTGMSSATSVAVDPGGNLYVVEINNRVRKIAAGTGFFSTVAGNGTAGYSGDGGPATLAQLNNAYGVVIDPSGTLFITEDNNYTVRAVNPVTGFITTIAGNPSATTYNSAQEGKPAISAAIESPTSIAVDGAGDLYVVEIPAARIQRITATGTLNSVAGNGTPGYNLTDDGGSATAASINLPFGVAVDSIGNLYIGDQGNNRVRKVNVQTPAGLTFNPTPVATISTDSPKLAIINNIGNDYLNFPKTAGGLSPVVSTGFTLNQTSASTCGIATASAQVFFSPGDTCAYSISFAPGAAGSFNGSASITDNNLNVASTQSIPLSGSGFVVAQTINFPALPTGFGYQPGITASLMATASSGLPVTYAVSGPATLSGTTVTYTGSGTVIITASQAGNATYSAAPNVSVTVKVLILPVLTWNPTPSSIYAGVPIGNSYFNAQSSAPGSFAYSVQPVGGSPSFLSPFTTFTRGQYIPGATFTPTDPNTYCSVIIFVYYLTVTNQNVFIANGNGSVASLYNGGATLSPQVAGGGTGLAIDFSGNVWSINSDGLGVSKFTDTGLLSASYSGSGIQSAQALSVDGTGRIWIANGSGSNSLSVLTNAGASGQNTVLGRAFNINNPASLSIDTAGSVWLANSGNDTVLELIGAASPVVTPTVFAVQNSTLGSQP